MIKAEGFKTFIREYFLSKSKRLRANNKLTIHRKLIRSVITFAPPAWEFAPDDQIMKL
jgi:hypothetical protein